MKKYEIKKIAGQSRVVALKNFANVKKGDIGGVVTSEHNLSQEGDCWIYYSAKVTGWAKVLGNSKISGSAVVKGSAIIEGDSIIDDSVVSGSAKLTDVKVMCKSEIKEHAHVISSKIIHSVVRDHAFVLRSNVTYSCISHGIEIHDDSVDGKNIDNM